MALYVEPNSRRQGLGSKLIKHALHYVANEKMEPGETGEHREKEDFAYLWFPESKRDQLQLFYEGLGWRFEERAQYLGEYALIGSFPV